MTRPSKGDQPDGLPPLPLAADHWQAIVQAMGLSPQQAKVVELVLRGASDKQVASEMRISKATIRTYLDRIWVRTRCRGRMELAMRVLAVSHEVKRNPRRHHK